MRLVQRSGQGFVTVIEGVLQIGELVRRSVDAGHEGLELGDILLELALQVAHRLGHRLMQVLDALVDGVLAVLHRRVGFVDFGADGLEAVLQGVDAGDDVLAFFDQLVEMLGNVGYVDMKVFVCGHDLSFLS